MFQKSIIGWYRFHRNAVLIPSISDIRFHSQLSNFFDKISVPTNKFLLCLFNYDLSVSVEHKFNHVFYRFDSG